MTDYLTVYTSRGRLSYLPEQHQQCLDLSTGLFRNRARRPHRIRIANVAPEIIFDTSDPRRSRSSTLFNEKLAGSRENAKRFLRSFIASHAADKQAQAPPPPPASLPDPARSLSQNTQTSGSSSPAESQRRWSSADVMRSQSVDASGGPIAGLISRPALVDPVRSSPRLTAVKQAMTATVSKVPEEKPLASGNGISVSVSMAEPYLYLQGFEHPDGSEIKTVMLRGNLHVRVTKPAKIKAVTLHFRGKAITRWPEGIPPKKTDFEEVDTIMRHTWPFFNAALESAEASTGADHVELFKNNSHGHGSKRSSFDVFGRDSPNQSSTNLSTKEAKRLSLQVNQSRSFGKGESSTGGPSVAQKGYRTFNPGDYIYNFELPLDSRIPETIDVDLGSVKYELEAVVERAGAFRANLVGTKEVELIRAPSEGSLEQVEPIAISRNWEDQLHYDIVISGKSFPLGATVPIAFKLTPLAKVQCQRIKVFVTENVEYFCQKKRVHRLEPTRKILLFEKTAKGSPVSTFPGSSCRIVSGGGVPYDQRNAAARGEDVEVNDPTNLLGDLNGECNIGPTEMEVQVQLPRCSDMKQKEKNQKLHFDTTYQNIQVHHWIKIVLRLAKQDENDPNKKRHFEISIDSPFHILSCHARQANLSLPAYSEPEYGNDAARLPECGCPGAPIRRNSPTSFVPTLNALNGNARMSSISLDQTESSGLARPQQAHIGGPIDSALHRPIHLVRQPSFDPPEFTADDPPPPLETPPPLYESIASPTSGLADYFARLSDAYDEDSDGISRSRSRIDIPLTPGSRVNRSMDEPRTWLPIGH